MPYFNRDFPEWELNHDHRDRLAELLDALSGRSICAEAKDLLGHMLVLDPAARWTAERCLSHVFFADLLAALPPPARSLRIAHVFCLLSSHQPRQGQGQSAQSRSLSLTQLQGHGHGQLLGQRHGQGTGLGAAEGPRAEEGEERPVVFMACSGSTGEMGVGVGVGVGVHQREITPMMMAILVDWMVDVAAEFQLSAEVLAMAVQLVQRQLELRPISRKDFQLLGEVAVLVAAKVLDLNTIDLLEVVYISDEIYSPHQSREMEQRLLLSADLDLNPITFLHFLRIFVAVAAADSATALLAQGLCELFSLHPRNRCYPPSCVALAALVLASLIRRERAVRALALALHAQRRLLPAPYACTATTSAATASPTLTSGAPEIGDWHSHSHSHSQRERRCHEGPAGTTACAAGDDDGDAHMTDAAGGESMSPSSQLSPPGPGMGLGPRSEPTEPTRSVAQDVDAHALADSSSLEAALNGTFVGILLNLSEELLDDGSSDSGEPFALSSSSSSGFASCFHSMWAMVQAGTLRSAGTRLNSIQNKYARAFRGVSAPLYFRPCLVPSVCCAAAAAALPAPAVARLSALLDFRHSHGACGFLRLVRSDLTPPLSLSPELPLSALLSASATVASPRHTSAPCDGGASAANAPVRTAVDSDSHTLPPLPHSSLQRAACDDVRLPQSQSPPFASPGECEARATAPSRAYATSAASVAAARGEALPTSASSESVESDDVDVTVAAAAIANVYRNLFAPTLMSAGQTLRTVPLHGICSMCAAASLRRLPRPADNASPFGVADAVAPRFPHSSCNYVLSGVCRAASPVAQPRPRPQPPSQPQFPPVLSMLSSPLSNVWKPARLGTDFISLLPPDLVFHVLEFMPLCNLMSLCGVSRQYRRYCADARLTAAVVGGGLRFSAYRERVEDGTVLLLLPRLSRLRSLSLYRCQVSTSTVNAVLRFCRQLTHLDLGHVTAPDPRRARNSAACAMATLVRLPDQHGSAQDSDSGEGGDEADHPRTRTHRQMHMAMWSSPVPPAIEDGMETASPSEPPALGSGVASLCAVTSARARSCHAQFPQLLHPLTTAPALAPPASPLRSSSAGPAAGSLLRPHAPAYSHPLPALPAEASGSGSGSGSAVSLTWYVEPPSIPPIAVIPLPLPIHRGFSHPHALSSAVPSPVSIPSPLPPLQPLPSPSTPVSFFGGPYASVALGSSTPAASFAIGGPDAVSPLYPQRNLSFGDGNGSEMDLDMSLLAPLSSCSSASASASASALSVSHSPRASSEDCEAGTHSQCSTGSAECFCRQHRVNKRFGCPSRASWAALLARPVGSVLCAGPGLESLDLRSCDLVTAPDLLSLFATCPSLKTLHLGMLKRAVKPQVLAALCASAFASVLEELHLNSNPSVDDASILLIAQSCRALRHLFVDMCENLTDAAVASVAKQCSRLHSLGVSTLPVSDETLTEIGLNCSDLSVISLSFCYRVTSVGVLRLVRGCPKLRVVNLCLVDLIRDEAVIALAETSRDHLEELNLRGCSSITDRALASLGDCCSRLRILHLLDCRRVTHNAVKAVKAVNKKCLIIH